MRIYMASPQKSHNILECSMPAVVRKLTYRYANPVKRISSVLKGSFFLIKYSNTDKRSNAATMPIQNTFAHLETEEMRKDILEFLKKWL